MSQINIFPISTTVLILVIASLLRGSTSDGPEEHPADESAVDILPDIPPYTPLEGRKPLTHRGAGPSECPCPSTSPNGTVAYCGHEMISLSSLSGGDAEKCNPDLIYICYEPSIHGVGLRLCRSGKHHRKGCGIAQDDHKWNQWMRACNVP